VAKITFIFTHRDGRGSQYYARGNRLVKQHIEKAVIDAGLEPVFLDHTEYCPYDPSPEELDRMYKYGNKGLFEFYKIVEREAANSIALVAWDRHPLHPEFLWHLKCKKVMFAMESPEGVYRLIVPFAHCFDMIFYNNPFYSPGVRMEEMLRRWGCKSCHNFHYGVKEVRYNAEDEEQVFSLKRDIDLVFVGQLYNKCDRIMKIKKHFGERMKICGNWSYKSMLAVSWRHKIPLWVRPVDDLNSLYARAKIGINFHITYGIGNARLFEVPANGAMLLSDGVGYGLEEIFRLGDEALGFNDVDEAIDKIEYYLSHDDERIKIARKGFQRVIDNYLMPTTLKYAIHAILEETKK